MWITTADGSINLDRVQTTVSNSLSTSKAAMQKMLRSIDASQYA